MPRRKRPYLPGTVFHITARTQCGAPFFNERIRDQLVELLAACMPRSDARLLAYCLMTNHLHLVVRQGVKALTHLLQPLMRRIAYRVQRELRTEDHVFGSRYYASPCMDAAHVRDTITYVHLNPVRAGVCDAPGDYAWSSHAVYSGALTVSRPATRLVSVPLVPVLDLFATAANRTSDQLQSDYLRYVASRLAEDARVKALDALAKDLGCAVERKARGAGCDELVREPPPTTHAGDAYWSQHYPTIDSPIRQPTGDRLDLRDLALHVIAERCPGVALDALRMPHGGRKLVAVRREIVGRAAAMGYRGVTIAAFLNVSDSAVSAARVAWLSSARDNRGSCEDRPNLEV